MEDKASKRALEAYPKDIEEYIDVKGVKSVVDNNSWQRTIFLEGYHQAEKDLELSWEDMRELHIIFTKIDVDIELGMTDIKQETLGYYQEILKRFKDYKERKEK